MITKKEVIQQSTVSQKIIRLLGNVKRMRCLDNAIKISVLFFNLLSLANGLNNWDILAGKVELKDGVLALDGATILWKEEAPEDFILKVRVKMVEKRGNAEACIIVKATEDASQFCQIFMDQPSNSLRAVVMKERKWRSEFSVHLPFILEIGKWYNITVAVKGSEAFGYVEGRQYLHILYIDIPSGKRVGLRVGDGLTCYADFRVQKLPDPSSVVCNLGFKCPTRCYLLANRWIEKSALVAGDRLEVKIPTLLQPTQLVSINIGYKGKEPLRLKLYDAKGNIYHSQRVARGGEIKVMIVGCLGKHRLEINSKKGKVIDMSFEVGTRTAIATKSGKWKRLFDTLEQTVKRDRFFFVINGKSISMNPTWLRDHIHELKGYKWWEEDIRSAFDHFLASQHPEGFFYEMIISSKDPHTTYVEPKHRILDDKNGLAYVRLELEADIEYLMVEGVYQAWQVTGDDEWLREALPHLIRGMEYCMSDPTRWDKQYGLVKRPFTIDTWDFTYGVEGNDRRIRENTPMSIMHGDNSGMYEASLVLTRMCEVLGDKRESGRWRKIAEQFRERTNNLCWNGRFYTHQVHLNHPGAPGVDEKEILSLSNAYDINRRLPDHNQAISIINEYKRRREEAKGKYFAEWFSLYPPYPEFKGHNMPPGTYINGGLAGFVAGELAKAALWEGEEDYGVDILKRVAEKVEKDGDIFFLYTPDGRDQGGGPRGWSAAAVISALIEGLAGIKDEHKLLQKALIAPRWVATGEDRAEVVARYGASDAYIAYIFEHNERSRTIQMDISSSGVVPGFHILLPKGKEPMKVLFNGTEIPFKEAKTQESIYCDFHLDESITKGHIVVNYD